MLPLQVLRLPCMTLAQLLAELNFVELRTDRGYDTATKLHSNPLDLSADATRRIGQLFPRRGVP